MTTLAIIGFFTVFLTLFFILPRVAFTVLLIWFFDTNPPALLANPSEFVTGVHIVLGSLFIVLGLVVDLIQAYDMAERVS